MTKKCYNCGKETSKEMYNYPICDSCKSKLKLFTEQTIKKHYKINPEEFSKEIQRRLELIDIEYVSKKIKLLHVQEHLKNF